MAKVTGRVTVKINGETLRSAPGASIQVGGVTREAVPNDQGTVDYRETTAAAEVSATLVHVAETDLIALRDFVGGTVNYETDTGVTYVIGDAFVTELGELSEGEVEVTFSGNPAEQV
ncbi:MAG TPA: phage tail tube protein [Brevibacterium sp.]|nr:phage tail tube protein [Brevibacterium sp.]